MRTSTRQFKVLICSYWFTMVSMFALVSQHFFGESARLAFGLASYYPT